MSKRKDAQPGIPEGARDKERPQRPPPEPETLEGPGGRQAVKSEEDARNQTTRQGER